MSFSASAGTTTFASPPARAQGLTQGVGRKGFPFFVLISSENTSGHIGTTWGIPEKTRNANRNKSEENGEIGTNWCHPILLTSNWGFYFCVSIVVREGPIFSRRNSNSNGTSLGNANLFTTFLFTTLVPLKPPFPTRKVMKLFSDLLLKGPQTELRILSQNANKLSQNCKRTEL